jgi:hypothetical protein
MNNTRPHHHIIDLEIKGRNADTGHARIDLPSLPTDRYGLSLVFQCPVDHLDRYIRYARFKDESASRRRFVDIQFKHQPPGTPVGPWPGWRSIPDVAKVVVSAGSTQVRAVHNFWGEERDTQRLGFFARIALNPDTRQLDLEWDDSDLVPVQLEIIPGTLDRPEPIPLDLAETYPSHSPRLLFSHRDLADLRSRRLTTHQTQWRAIENTLNHWHLNFAKTTESKTLPGPERLDLPDRALLSAFHAMITRDEDSLRRARQAFDTYLEHALSPDYEPMTIDTQAGECLFTLSLALDWLWPHLNPQQQNACYNQLCPVAHRVRSHLTPQREDFAQAHYLGCGHGLLAFALLFHERLPDATDWIAELNGAFHKVLRMLPDDGFYPHGINLWVYEHTFLVRLLELLGRASGQDLWAETSYWRNTSEFRRMTLSPDGQLGITFGDPQYRVSGDAWIHFLIAIRTQSATAQSLGLILQDQPTHGVDIRSVPPRRKIWEYLYYRPDIPAQQLTSRVRLFADGGQVIWRETEGPDTWLLTTRAGYPLGRQRYEAGEWSGYGHSDPANGAFLMVHNKTFWLCGPGPVYRRDTRLHNTVTIDGRGQVGDGLPWAPNYIPKHKMAHIVALGAEPNLQWVEMELTPAYLDPLEVNQLTRRLVWLVPDILIAVDHIRLDHPHRIEWNLHTMAEIHKIDEQQNRLWLKKGSDQLEIQWHMSKPVNLNTGLTPFIPAYPHEGTRDRTLTWSDTSDTLDCYFLIGPPSSLKQIALVTTPTGDWEIRRNRTDKEALVFSSNRFGFPSATP